MTDHLEPYRRLARAIRFAPQLPQSQPSDKLAERLRSVPPPSHSYVTQVSQAPQETPFGPPLDPSEHAAQLIRAAVSKQTAPPVTYNIQENIGDRISHLTPAKPPTRAIVLPKIPQPDPNWVPPTPVVIEQVATAAETPSQLTETAPVLFTQPSAESPEETASLVTETAAELPTQIQAESPEETPSQITETAEELPTQAQAESPEEAPSQITETAAELPTQAQVELPEETPSQITETSEESSTQAQVESPEETPSQITETAAELPTQPSVESAETPLPGSQTIQPIEKLPESTDADKVAINVEQIETPAAKLLELDKPNVPVIEESKTHSKTAVEDTTPPDAEEQPNIVETVAHQLKNAVDTLTQLPEQVVAATPAVGKKSSSSRKGLIQEIVCPKCKSNKVKEKGSANGQLKYVCKNCGKRWRVDLERNEDND